MGLTVRMMCYNSIFSDEHREKIKARVLMFLDEPNNAVSLLMNYLCFILNVVSE